jgi:ectoine hydroxylase-related dioxygenase (phytanoyl-CoA dioxygenase family)
MLNQSEISQYQKDGQITPDVRLAPATVRELNDKMEQFFARVPGVDQDFAPDIIDQDNSWLKYAAMPEILDVVSSVIGDDIIVWGSALFAKKAIGGKATPWHQDGHYWPIRPLATVTAWIAIDDVGTDNGCLRVIPATHTNQVLYEHSSDKSGEAILNQELNVENDRFGKPRDVVLAPGQFSIHDAYLIHGAEPNESGRRRAGLVFRYMPATSFFDRELARELVRDMGVLDLSKRQLHLVRGTDRSGRNEIYSAPPGNV